LVQISDFSNLTKADGPWEPSAVLGDKLLAAVAFGCPALKTLEVRMICKLLLSNHFFLGMLVALPVPFVFGVWSFF
jgi:hypothetical protein